MKKIPKIKIFSLIMAIFCSAASAFGFIAGLVHKSPFVAYIAGVPSALAAMAWFIIFYKEDCDGN